MSYILSHRPSSVSSLTTMTIELPPVYAAGDLLFSVIWTDQNNALFPSVPVGWTGVTIGGDGGTTNNAGYVTVISKIATSSSEADPITTIAVADSMVAQTFAARGDTPTIDFCVSDLRVPTGSAFPSVTTTKDNNLLLWLFKVNTGDEVPINEMEDYGQVDDSIGGTGMRLSAYKGVQETAGLTESPTIMLGWNETMTIVIGDSANNYIEPYLNANPITKVCRWLNNLKVDDVVDAGATDEDPVLEITAINGEATVYWGTNSSAQAGKWIKNRDDITLMTASTVNALNIMRQNYNGATLDLSGGAIFACHVTQYGDFIPDLAYCLDKTKDGVIFVFEDGLGNWEAYNVPPGSFAKRGDSFNLLQINLGASTTLDSSGTLNRAAVTKISYAFHKGDRSNNYIAHAETFIINDFMVLAGGGVANPLGAVEVAQIVGQLPEYSAFSQGGSQLFAVRGVQIGDATHKVYADFTYDSIEFVSNEEALTSIHDGGLGIKILTTASSIVNFNNCIINGTGQYQFSILAGAAGTLDISNSQILNANSISLRSPVVADGAFLSNFSTFTLNDADLSGGITFDSTTGLYAVSVSTQAALTQLANCIFSNNSVALQVTGDQTTLTLDGMQFAGNTYDLEYTGDTDLTLTLANGCNLTPAKILLSGLGTVTIAPTPVTVEITVKDAVTKAVIEGARVYLEAGAGGPATEGTVIFNELTGVSGIVTTASYSYTGDQPVIGRVRKSTAAPYYKTSDIVGTITSSGFYTTVLMIGD